ncbi:MAG: hypothetical protein ACLRWM_00915 [Streptococcus sp.]
MMPFKKNRNEAAYFDGKSILLMLLKYRRQQFPDMETAGGGF